MAAATILDFNFLPVGAVKKVELHHCAKFRRNRLNRSRDTAIIRFRLKMAAAAMLDFWN